MKSVSALGLGVAMMAPGLAQAEGASVWWPLEVQDIQDKGITTFEYTPLEKAEKAWNLCVLFPHLKDSVWVAFNYGVIETARRLGVKVTLFDAGGYTELNKQLSQYDDCLALEPDAILFAAISEAAIANKVQEGKARGIAQIALINPVSDAVPYDAQVYGDYSKMAEYAAQFLVDKFEGAEGELSAVTFPGPQGSGWAESAGKAMRDTLEGSNIKIVAEKFGDTGKNVQLGLVEDTLQAFPDVDILLLNGVAAEIAPTAVMDAGREDEIELTSWYVNDGSLRNVISGEVSAAALQISVPMASIGVDLAIRVLEEKDYVKRVGMLPQMLTKDAVTDEKLLLEFAPSDWRPVYSVE